MRHYLAFFLALAIARTSQATNSNQAAPNGSESLGNRLLDDLPLDTSPPAAPQQPARNPNAMKAFENSIKASAPIAGFGVGTNPTTQPLIHVQQGMQHAQSLLAQSGAETKAGAAQQEVISDLDKLIAELSKQCQGGQCQGGECKNGDQPKPGQKPQSKSGKSGVAVGRGQSAARDSTDRLDRTTAKPVDKHPVDEMVKALWGQLPARNREKMLQSFSDEFLPKYEFEIEQYYRRLSEEQNQEPR